MNQFINNASDASPANTLLKRLGWAGFAFFLSKGLLWLVVPILLTWLNLA